MNTQETDTSIFHSLRFVLVETSHPGNIGSAARALKTMGFDQLVLVKPRFEDALKHPEAQALASGSLDVLENARIVNSIQEALDGCTYAAAVTARFREFSPKIITPREFAETAFLEGNSPKALVFGNERYGLPNEIVEQCNSLIHIPANPVHSSLNLAQAVQILAYECRMATLNGGQADSSSNGIGFQGTPATFEQINGMFEHLERALIATKFLNPQAPKKLMPRLRRMFSRCNLETEEVNIIRGLSNQIESLTKK